MTPGISALEYHHRRAALARKLPRNSIAVLASNELKYRSSAVFYEFHQEPNFYYLTGAYVRCPASNDALLKSHDRLQRARILGCDR